MTLTNETALQKSNFAGQLLLKDTQQFIFSMVFE